MVSPQVAGFAPFFAAKTVHNRLILLITVCFSHGHPGVPVTGLRFVTFLAAWLGRFPSTPNSRLCILTQCRSLVPSLKALNDSFSMNETPSTMMLLHFAPNSTLFTSLPLTTGLTYGFDTLTILSGMLSLAHSAGCTSSRTSAPPSPQG